MTPSGIETANCRLVAQCLNQLRNRVPLNYFKGTRTFNKTKQKTHKFYRDHAAVFTERSIIKLEYSVQLFVFI
jgi:hypothetical protein